MTRKTCKPSFYDRFQCIGSACTDTCCAGWEIDIDDISYENYMGLEGTFKQRLLSQISTDGESHFFRLQEGQRCPFLNRDNLCDIFIEAGEEYLCDICTEHPRFYNWYGAYTEMGLGMCCEEAQRLMLERETPLTFVVTEEVDDGSERDAANTWEETEEYEASQIEMEEPETDPFLPLLLSLREKLFGILQDRSRSIWQRIIQVQQTAEQVQKRFDTIPEEEWEAGLEQFLTQISAMSGDFPKRSTSAPVQGIGEEEVQEEVNWLEKLLQPMAGDGSVLDFLQDIISFFLRLEILDEAWPARLRQIQGHLPRIWDNRQAFLAAYGNRCYEYEHLMVYFLYRYFLEGAYNLELCVGVEFAWSSVVMILLCDIVYWMDNGELPFEFQCAIIRLYSKEIEYCPENVEAVCQYIKQLRENAKKVQDINSFAQS